MKENLCFYIHLCMNIHHSIMYNWQKGNHGWDVLQLSDHLLQHCHPVSRCWHKFASPATSFCNTHTPGSLDSHVSCWVPLTLSCCGFSFGRLSPWVPRDMPVWQKFSLYWISEGSKWEIFYPTMSFLSPMWSGRASSWFSFSPAPISVWLQFSL